MTATKTQRNTFEAQGVEKQHLRVFPVPNAPDKDAPWLHIQTRNGDITATTMLTHAQADALCIYLTRILGNSKLTTLQKMILGTLEQGPHYVFELSDRFHHPGVSEACEWLELSSLITRDEKGRVHYAF